MNKSKFERPAVTVTGINTKKIRTRFQIEMEKRKK